MKTLIKGGTVVNVFTDELVRENILIEDGVIIGVGDYEEADIIENAEGKFICPSFIDGHIHIESTMMTPRELAKVSLVHGTTAVVADPHEIANVCGTAGIDYMLKASEGLPMEVYIMLPSCVPSTPFDESGAVLAAADLKPYYDNPRVLGLAEMMNYHGVIVGDSDIKRKIADAKAKNKAVDGHAPLLTGHNLDKYIAEGIETDHECSGIDEAKERIGKGQWVMIRQGTAARNLEGLIDLFEEPYNRRCLLVTDDRDPADLIAEGHIDNIVRRAAAMGKSVVAAIRMASIQAAQCFGLKRVGAIAPGYRADLLVLNDLETVDIKDVYAKGVKVVADGKEPCIGEVDIPTDIMSVVTNSFDLTPLASDDFLIENKGGKCRVIKTIPDQLLTEEWITDIDFEKNNGIDLNRDILKIAVIERHKRTGHRGVGFISGIGLKRGAVASSISHDCHNLIVIGTSEADMACAANAVIETGGGCAAVDNGEVLYCERLPIGGLMGDKPAAEMAEEHRELLRAIDSLGVPEGGSPLMTTAFVSLAVIPSLKMTTLGLIDVNRQELVPLFV